MSTTNLQCEYISESITHMDMTLLLLKSQTYGHNQLLNEQYFTVTTTAEHWQPNHRDLTHIHSLCPEFSFSGRALVLYSETHIRYKKAEIKKSWGGTLFLAIFLGARRSSTPAGYSPSLHQIHRRPKKTCIAKATSLKLNLHQLR